jgi:hypothetical protein
LNITYLFYIIIFGSHLSDNAGDLIHEEYYITLSLSRLSDNAGDLIHEEYYITLSLDISNVMLRAVWKYP